MVSHDLPLIYICESKLTSHAAGGKAVNSKMDRMLEVVPEHIHDRSGIFMGSEQEVQKVIDTHKKFQK
jgi:fructose-1,6-bisphosphatase I